MVRAVRLIALSGLPRSGKDTLAQHLYARHNFLPCAFSDPLKGAAAILLDRPVSEMRGDNGFDREALLPEWGFSTRWFLQVLGTECMRDQVRPDFWIHRMRNRLAAAHLPIVIPDCRFENEAALVRELGGTVVEIYREGCCGSGHPSDAGVKPDQVIFNNGSIEALWERGDELAKAIKG